MKITRALCALLVLVTACATPQLSPETQAGVNLWTANCQAGMPGACDTLRSFQNIADSELAEKRAQNNAVAAGVLGVLLGAAAGAASARYDSRPTYILVRRCRWC